MSAPLSPRPLPAWPLVATTGGFMAWWALGLGDFVWLLAAGVMAFLLIRRRAARAPRHAWVWICFLAWVAVSMGMVDTPGRMVGALYRLCMYAAAGVIALYVLNARVSLTWRVVSGAMVLLLANMTLGGLIAMADPDLVIRTPLAQVMPAGLMDNELVRDMVVRQVSQWNPDAWVQRAPRPSAPFLYANTWGSMYALVLPLSISYLWCGPRRALRVGTLAVIALSVIPAMATLNRGMLLGLGVALLWWIGGMVRAGSLGGVVAALAVLAAGGAGFVASGAAARLDRRLDTSSSTEDRGELYFEVLDRVRESPLWGFGAPRPSLQGLVSAGTQGQYWNVLFSHGWVGLVLFAAFLLLWLGRAWRRLDAPGILAGSAIAVTLVISAVYGMTIGLMITMTAIGLLARVDPPAPGLSRPAARTPAMADSRGRAS